MIMHLDVQNKPCPICGGNVRQLNKTDIDFDSSVKDFICEKFISIDEAHYSFEYRRTDYWCETYRIGKYEVLIWEGNEISIYESDKRIYHSKDFSNAKLLTSVEAIQNFLLLK